MQETDRTTFQPPKPGGTGRSFALALLAHGLLLLALTWGIRWNNQADTMSVSAELWSALPQEAAPPLQAPEPAETPPPSPQPPEPVKAPEPAPPPPPQAAPQPDRADADIALQKEKAQREKKEREDKLQKDKELKAKAEKLKEDKLKEDKRKAAQEREDQEREKKKMAEKAKADEKAKQWAQDKKRAEEQAQKEAQAKAEAEKRSEAQRQENIRRMQGLAGATGSEDAKGTALKSSGPSAGYAGRIVARIKPKITFNDDVDGNPKAEVEVRVAADGTIVSRKLIQASGNKAWDDAVLKAIDKTETLPRDTDGRVQPVMVISFRPKD